MYFRFPILLLIIISVSIGFFYYSMKLKNRHPFAENDLRESVNIENRHTVVKNDALESPKIVDPLEVAVNSVREHELRAHLKFLADDIFEGRETGTRGANLASNYIASQFEEIGLKPVGEAQSFFQYIPLRQKMIMPNSELKIEVDSELIPLKYREDFLVVNNPNENEFELSGDLVFTGYGIQAPEFNYDDFKDVDVEGKVTVYINGEPSSIDADYFEGAKPSKFSSGFTKRKIAQDMKAAGSIGIVTPKYLDQMNWENLHDMLTRKIISLDNDDSENNESFYPALIIHPDAGDLLFAGTQRSFDEIKKAALENKLNSFEMTKKVQMKINVEEKKLVDRNVVGFLEGSDPVLKSEVVIYTAHFDHLGIGTPVQGDSIYNGAADNASGVAGLIELAEAFSLLPEVPKRSILFLAVTAEEAGLLGSKYYVNNPIFPLSNTVANFNLDMIGIGDTTGVVAYGIERSTLGEVITKAANKIQLRILPDELPEENIFQRSDHYNFARQGVPSIYPVAGFDKQFLPKFDSFYHQPSDDINLPFNYTYMKKHVQILFLAGFWVANAKDAPKWTAGDEFEKINN